MRACMNDEKGKRGRERRGFSVCEEPKEIERED